MLCSAGCGCVAEQGCAARNSRSLRVAACYGHWLYISRAERLFKVSAPAYLCGGFDARSRAMVVIMSTRILRGTALIICLLVSFAGLTSARGEAMLELFQMSWADLTQKMPDLAEAGYPSLWLPEPAKGGSVFSVGYDLFDPFDLRSEERRVGKECRSRWSPYH